MEKTQSEFELKKSYYYGHWQYKHKYDKTALIISMENVTFTFWVDGQ